MPSSREHHTPVSNKEPRRDGAGTGEPPRGFDPQSHVRSIRSRAGSHSTRSGDGPCLADRGPRPIAEPSLPTGAPGATWFEASPSNSPGVARRRRGASASACAGRHRRRASGVRRLNGRCDARKTRLVERADCHALHRQVSRLCLGNRLRAVRDVCERSGQRVATYPAARSSVFSSCDRSPNSRRCGRHLV